MTAARTTLSDFLLARIAEVEEDAHEANTYASARWEVADSDEVATIDGRPVAQVDHGALVHHVARHDPARVLADCEAKRRIVALGPTACPMGDPADELSQPHYPDPAWKDVPHWDRCENCVDAASADGAWRSVTALLALPYADHPDYDESWRP